MSVCIYIYIYVPRREGAVVVPLALLGLAEQGLDPLRGPLPRPALGDDEELPEKGEVLIYIYIYIYIYICIYVYIYIYTYNI